jgi:pimeloyl-ACP methyl ester carboxylesterase
MEREMLRLFDAQYGREDIDAIAIAPQMTVPLLVLHDREDAEIPFGDAEAYAETWPGSELAAISGVGHRRILRSRAVVDRIVRFLGPLE